MPNNICNPLQTLNNMNEMWMPNMICNPLQTLNNMNECEYRTCMYPTPHAKKQSAFQWFQSPTLFQQKPHDFLQIRQSIQIIFESFWLKHLL